MKIQLVWIRIEESCTIGAYNQRDTDLRRRDGKVMQGVTNSSVVITGHGSSEIALTGGETPIEE